MKINAFASSIKSVIFPLHNKCSIRCRTYGKITKFGSYLSLHVLSKTCNCRYKPNWTSSWQWRIISHGWGNGKSSRSKNYPAIGIYSKFVIIDIIVRKIEPNWKPSTSYWCTSNAYQRIIKRFIIIIYISQYSTSRNLRIRASRRSK